jgi:hypothetical protein
MKSSSTDQVDASSWADEDRFIDESDVLLPGEHGPEHDVWADGSAHSAGVRALEDTTVRSRVLTADQYAGIAEVLRDAAAHPDPWVGADPTLDPAWRDPRDRAIAAVRRERCDIAVRAAAADIACRLGMSETTVRTRAAHAEALRERCPRVWRAFASGAVPEQNAVTAAHLALSLPDDREIWAAFDEGVKAAASALPPAKFRTRARVVRERVHGESLDERHRRAARDRGAWISAELDGMATLNVFAPAAEVHAAFGRLDAIARHLHDQDGEERTLTQLRADALTDLLTSGETVDSGPASSQRAIAVTVPVLGLLGKDDEQATLDGYGPIDLETARRLAGGAKSWVRILTHPVTGTVLDVDRRTYRVPKALRRWLGVRDPVCTFPGCTRTARECQIDHRVEWQYGGTTKDTNLAPLCEPHHVVKTKSEWKLYRDEITGASWWVTPTALTVDPDPPPW